MVHSELLKPDNFKPKTPYLLSNPNDISWNSAKHFEKDQMIIAPIDIHAGNKGTKYTITKYLVAEENTNGNITNGYYCYVLSNEGKPALSPSLLSGKRTPLDFKGAILTYNLAGDLISTQHYDYGMQTNKKDRLTTKRNQNETINTQSIVPENCEAGGEVVCIDWYWQTYVNGVLTDEEYLYTSCQCQISGDGTGGGGTLTPEQICQAKFDEIVESGSAISEKIGSTLIYESPDTRSRDYSWKIFACTSGVGGTVWLVSHELGTQTLGSDNKWHWESLVHGNITTEGFSIYDVVGTTNTAYSVMGTGYLDGYASMNLNYNAKVTFICGLINLFRPKDYETMMGWHVNYGWTPSGNSIPINL